MHLLLEFEMMHVRGMLGFLPSTIPYANSINSMNWYGMYSVGCMTTVLIIKKNKNCVVTYKQNKCVSVLVALELGLDTPMITCKR